MVYKDIAAIILAAGESRRMGQSKLTLPWGETTVLGQVVATFAAAGIEDILVVTGGEREGVEAEISRLEADFPVRAIFNAGYATGGMLSSLQRGLADLSLPLPVPPLLSPAPLSSPHSRPFASCFFYAKLGENGETEGGKGRVAEGRVGMSEVRPERRATLITLGDQPQVQESLVQRICAAFTKTGKHLIVPSFQMRRGHPWLAARPLWPEILALPANQTPRDFINAHSEDILYLPVETDSILLDVDTPEDHERLKPRT